MWAHAVLILLGLAGVVWALSISAHPVITCREVVMQPGEVCRNAEGTKTQTYEERWNAAQQARPVIGVMGGAAAAFGAALAVGEARAARVRP